MTPMRVDQDATSHPLSRIRSASSKDVLWHPRSLQSEPKMIWDTYFAQML
jgi:hypothetical protein